MKNYKIQISNKRTLLLPLVRCESQSYYSFNLLGEVELNDLFARELSNKLKDKNIDVFVTIESKAIGLTETLSRILNLSKFIVVRKSRKSYMVDPIFIEGKTIISGNAVYWLDGADLDYIKNKNIAICDDVISTGGTIKSVLHLLEKAQIKPKYIVCALTEGIERKEIYGLEVITCGHFPLPGENND